MRMAVSQYCMGVFMSVRFAVIPREIVRVLVMLVVCVTVRVGDRFMSMQVLVPFGQVQPHTGTHQKCSQPEHP